MAGGTHVFDMIKRLRDNENLRKKNYFKTRDTYHRTAESINVELVTATKEEQEKIRTKIIEDQNAETKRTIKLLLVSIALILLVLLSLYYRNAVNNRLDSILKLNGSFRCIL